MVRQAAESTRTSAAEVARRSRRPEINEEEERILREATQHLIRTLDKEGESAAAVLLHKLGGVAETARDLAYRLYTVCERKKWAEEALAYNGLVIAWSELNKLALAERTRSPETQHDMF